LKITKTKTVLAEAWLSCLQQINQSRQSSKTANPIKEAVSSTEAFKATSLQCSSISMNLIFTTAIILQIRVIRAIKVSGVALTCAAITTSSSSKQSRDVIYFDWVHEIIIQYS